MSRRTLTGLSMACAALLVPLTACSTDHPQVKKTSQPTRWSGSSATDSPVQSTSEPGVQQPPELDADETLAGRQQVTRGNATLAFRKGKKGDALIVAVRCQGPGTINVAVRSVHVSFSLDCPAGQVSTTYNQVGIGRVDRGGVVSVEAPSDVRWSMTIGRAPRRKKNPPQQHLNRSSESLSPYGHSRTAAVRENPRNSAGSRSRVRDSAHERLLLERGSLLRGPISGRR